MSKQLSLADNISSHQSWVILRAYISTVGEHKFEYLSSSDLNEQAVTLFDSSWADCLILRERFSHSKTIHNAPLIPTSPSEKNSEYHELDFME